VGVIQVVFATISLDIMPDRKFLRRLHYTL
jgi:hypothetical protein